MCRWCWWAGLQQVGLHQVQGYDPAQLPQFCLDAEGGPNLQPGNPQVFLLVLDCCHLHLALLCSGGKGGAIISDSGTKAPGSTLDNPTCCCQYPPLQCHCCLCYHHC